jgi:uncharacterized protein YndB with AHSA1/START domain
MNKGLVAKASIDINASIEKVWEALITPAIIKQYMFGTDVVSEWEEGGSIIWKGTWEGKPYEDKGTILKVKTLNTLQYSHYSPLSGVPDLPANYHTLTYELSDEKGHTLVSLSQDNNADEKAKVHSEKMWTTLLVELKKVLENK